MSKSAAMKLANDLAKRKRQLGHVYQVVRIERGGIRPTFHVVNGDDGQIERLRIRLSAISATAVAAVITELVIQPKS